MFSFYFVIQSTFIMNTENYLKDISEIKSLMHKSTRFFSLSGLAGILAGVYAIIGALIAYFMIDYSDRKYVILHGELFYYIVLDLFLIALLSSITAIVLSYRKAQKNNESLWDATSKRLLLNFLVPLITGGIYIIIKIFSNHYGHTGALMLIFYGLALINASKYTLGNVQYLGYAEVVLGLLCSIFPGYVFFFWIAGFGVMHIIYGSMIYFKHDR